jgi:Flp pilus assembly protein TadG
MTHARFASAPAHPLQRFISDQDGVSAVEFALVLPLMLTLYLGGVEVSQAVSADRKTMMAAYTMGDLISRENCVSSTTDVPNVFTITNEVIYPFSGGNLKAVVSGVSIDTNGKATVAWSQANSNGTARATGSDVSSSIPAALRPTGSGVTASYLVWAEAVYSYKPAIGYVLTGTINLKEQVYMRPRKSSTSITWQSAACSSS